MIGISDEDLLDMDYKLNTDNFSTFKKNIKKINKILDYLDDQIDRTEESAQAWDLITKILPREIDKIRDIIE